MSTEIDIARVAALRNLTSSEAKELLIVLERIAAMDVTHNLAAVFARNEARDAIDKIRKTS